MVSSAVPDEGKTFVATNLAISMAQSGRSVLLVDADMRNPGVADLLGLENSVGVDHGSARPRHARAGHPGARQRRQLPRHRTAAPESCRGARHPGHARPDAAVRVEYDVVIIDAPPMLPVADASILLTEVDGALLLTRHGTTSREQLRQAVARIEAVGGRLFGTVLNRTPRKVARLRLRLRYGYGYGHGTPKQPRLPSEDRKPVKVASRGVVTGAGRRARR